MGSRFHRPGFSVEVTYGWKQTFVQDARSSRDDVPAICCPSRHQLLAMHALATRYTRTSQTTIFQPNLIPCRDERDDVWQPIGRSAIPTFSTSIIDLIPCVTQLSTNPLEHYG